MPNNNIEINVQLCRHILFCMFFSGDGYRVRLRCGPVQGSDYINASFVNVRPHHTLLHLSHTNPLLCSQGYKQKGAYITCQGPLENTVADWWRMINEFKCGCIVMLCQLQEEGKVGLTTPAQLSASTSQTPLL